MRQFFFPSIHTQQSSLPHYQTAHTTVAIMLYFGDSDVQYRYIYIYCDQISKPASATVIFLILWNTREIGRYTLDASLFWQCYVNKCQHGARQVITRAFVCFIVCCYYSGCLGWFVWRPRHLNGKVMSANMTRWRLTYCQHDGSNVKMNVSNSWEDDVNMIPICQCFLNHVMLLWF